ncbi:MAG: ATP-binding protein, partial [Candidatus Omnitrophota bacterium]
MSRYFCRNPACRCSTTQVYKYRSKISGPLLDRIDIHIELQALRYQELNGNIPAESSIQKERFQNEGIMCNALMSHKQVRKFCVLGK